METGSLASSLVVNGRRVWLLRGLPIQGDPGNGLCFWDRSQHTFIVAQETAGETKNVVKV